MFALLLTGLASAGWLATSTASAHPLRGSTPFSVVLCQFSNRPVENPPTDVIRDFLVNESVADGVAAYWRSVSYGHISLSNSVVAGWYRMPVTYEEWPGGSGSRSWMIDTCLTAARSAPTNPYVVPARHRTIVFVNDCKDSGAAGNGVLLDPCAVNTGWAAHETGHGLGLSHSFSNDSTYKNAPWSSPGEYDDPWDLMSGMNFFARTTGQFGSGPPGLNGPYLDRMGWIPRNRVLTFGANGAQSASVRLAALSNPDAAGHLLVRIPFDPADLFHYYTVELRIPQGLDAAIPGAAVLFHEVRNGISYLIRSNRSPVQQLVDLPNGVRVTVTLLDPASASARVTISANVADRCLQGYVWREARPSDHVCVTGVRRQQTVVENLLAAARRSPTGGAFGPATCRYGYVWREAFLGDVVCVSPRTRSIVRAENATAATRKNPARLVFGPNTCKVGFVWREADLSDYVCVAGQTRAETRAENALAEQRREPGGGAFGPDTCRFGFVWREAFPNDHVCVLGASRARAAADNDLAALRVARP